MSIDPEDVFSLYEGIAVEIIDSTSPNDDVSLSYSNRELAENICQTMKWEEFDLFEHHNFEVVYEEGDAAKCLSYAFLSFLRWRLFTEASARGIGIEVFNIKAAAYSEYWYVKLVERWNESNAGSPMKAWIN